MTDQSEEREAVMFLFADLELASRAPAADQEPAAESDERQDLRDLCARLFGADPTDNTSDLFTQPGKGA